MYQTNRLQLRWQTLFAILLSVGACQGNKNGPVENVEISRKLRFSQLNGVWLSCQSEIKKRYALNFFHTTSLNKGSIKIEPFQDEACTAKDDQQEVESYDFIYELDRETLSGGFVKLIFIYPDNKRLNYTVEYSFAQDRVDTLEFPDIINDLKSPDFKGNSVLPLSLSLSDATAFITMIRLTNETDTAIVRTQLAAAMRPKLENKYFIQCDNHVGRSIRFDSYWPQDDALHGTYFVGTFSSNDCLNPGDQTTSFDFRAHLGGPEDLSDINVINVDFLVEPTQKTIKTMIAVGDDGGIQLIDLNPFKETGREAATYPSADQWLDILSPSLILPGTWSAGEHCYQGSDGLWDYRYQFEFADTNLTITRYNYFSPEQPGDSPCQKLWSTETLSGIQFYTEGTNNKTIKVQYVSSDSEFAYDIQSSIYPKTGYFFACLSGHTAACLIRINDFILNESLTMEKNQDSKDIVLTHRGTIYYSKL